ncbi:MAG: hypothetical protein JWM58_1760 [Rhizobium sp.]|nr:hypothetical protein [Rhizobium sp.]
MQDMVEGIRVHDHPDGTFDVEVVMKKRVVWSRGGFRVREMADDAGKREFDRLKQSKLSGK